MAILPLLQAAVGGYTRDYAAGWAMMGAGLGSALAVVGAGIGIGRLGGAAMDGMARQPERAGQIQIASLILAALIEGATLFAIVVSYQIQSKFVY